MMRTLRGRLVALVAALLAVTIGSVAVISTRVAHVQLQRLEFARPPHAPSDATLRDFHRAHGSWRGVQPVVAQLARDSGAGVYLFDDARQLVASSDPSRPTGRVTLDASGATLTYESADDGSAVRQRVRSPNVVIRDASGAIAGSVFILPPHRPGPTPARTLDVTFFWTFLGAALFGIALAMIMARWVSVPVERLTAAARRMESGDLTVRVEPAGGAELEELARGFNAMAAALDRNEELRRRMVGDVAHELRAPLTNIRCELESMQDGLAAPTPERIASLHQETMHLAALVDDLQDLALADAGRLSLDIRPVALAPLARRAASSFATRAIVCDGPDDLIVRADERRVVQIITNLLSNAVTHSDPDTTIRLTWQRQSNEALIRVIDQGIGIAPEDLPRIFDRFYRVDISRSRTTG
ncbi:MAG TPA: HAMP domain-containing protein, partial [Thermoanaerobaculia bacterium]